MAQAPSRIVQTASLEKPTIGGLTLDLYREVLEQVHEHNAVLTFTVSNGQDERIFFFTRGAILFLAVGATGGEVLARKLVAKGLLPQARVDALVKKANADVPLLQDLLLSENLLPPDTVKALVEETLEDHLVEVAFWDGLYDVNPGNPPIRIYDRDVPAVRLSVGLKPLLARVRPRVAEAPAILAALGGSVRNRVRRQGAARPASADERRLLDAVGSEARPIREVLDAAIQAGVPAGAAASLLAGLVRSQALALEVVPSAVARDEDESAARKIEAEFGHFVNRLLARSHLARIYERTGDEERAAEQYRGIADEHLARNNVQDGLAALRRVLQLAPQDLEVRELVVKVLQGANRLGEAAREAVELGRLLISVGLPGRARNAFELALKLVPGSVSVLWMLGGLLGALGYREDAVKVFEEIAERAEAAGDRGGAIAAHQQILAIEPLNERALAALRRYSGRGRALVARWATAGVALVLLAAVVGYGVYELVALDDWKKVRDEQVWPAVDARKFDVAREAAEGHARRFSLSWTATLARNLEARIDEEEAAAREQGFARDVRAARKLEEQGRVPEALETWRRARETGSPERKAVVEAAVKKDEERIAKVEAALAEAKKLDASKTYDRAHAVYAQAFAEGPWLAGQDVKVPCRIESVPRGARVWVDGFTYPDPTPLTVERKVAPGALRFEARGREPVSQAVEALPPWPIVVFLPRRPVWRVPALAASARPALARDAVVAAGTDGRIACVARADGAVRWSRSLGIFGEVELPPATVGEDLAVVRTVSGEVVALELATGAERWRRAVELPPLDAADAEAASPVGVPRGVLVREGPRGLVLLAAKDGTPVWSQKLRQEPTGAPAVSGELVALAAGRTVEAFVVADGRARWVSRLPGLATTSVGAVPGGGFTVATEPDELVRLDKAGAVVWSVRGVTGGRASAPPAGNAQTTVVGTSLGELVSFDARGLPDWRVKTGFERPVRWVSAVGEDLWLAGDEGTMSAYDGKGGPLWQHPCPGATAAVGDEARVYQGGARGLEALER